jgi:polysaccharide deacetylase 2 family uncharacterized protein YibQ
MKFFARLKELFTNRAFLKVFFANVATLFFILLGISIYNSAGENSLEEGLAGNKIIVADLANSRLTLGDFYSRDTQSKSLSGDILKKLAGKTEEGLKSVSDRPAVPQKPVRQSFRASELTPEYQKKNKIAILIDNLGLSKSITLDALKLPTNITLGFSPYANNLQEWLEHAVYQGFEVMLNLPMQPADYPIDDPGPYALLHNLSGYENLKRLNWVLNRTNKSIGLYSSEGEIFSNSRANMTPVFEKLKEMRQIFLYGGSRNAKVLRNIAENMQLEYANSSLIIDKILQSQEIKNNLYKLESIAQIRGSAVGVMRAYPMNIKLLKEWMANIENNKNLIVVPISNLFPPKENLASDLGTTSENNDTANETNEQETTTDNSDSDESSLTERKREDQAEDKQAQISTEKGVASVQHSNSTALDTAIRDQDEEVSGHTDDPVTLISKASHNNFRSPQEEPKAHLNTSGSANNN